MKAFYSTRSGAQFSIQPIIALWIALCLIMILFLYYSLHIRSDISFFLPEGQNTIDSIMQHQLTQGEAGKIILIALSEKTTLPLIKAPIKASTIPSKHLAEFNKKLTAQLKDNEQFVAVQNGSLSLTDLIIEPYYHYRYLLASQSETGFSNNSLRSSFEHLLQQLQLMPGSVEQKIFSEDPQMLWFALLRQWQTQQLKKHHGIWFDQQGKQSLLFVKTRADAYDLKQQKKNIELIKSHIEQLITTDKNLTYVLTGAPVFALESKKAISTQIKTISVIASFILLAFLYWFFRSLKIILLTALPLGFAVLTGMTTVILIDGFIHGITIAFGITIIGIAVDYPVHLYSHILFSNHKEKQTQQSIIQSIWPLIRLGLITTLIGFSAITLSDFSGLRQLGLFAISGLLAAAMVTRFLLPVIPIIKTKLTEEKTLTANTNAFKKVRYLVNFPLPEWIYSVSIILPVLALLYIGSQQSTLWQNNLATMSPVPEKQKQQDFQLRKAMGLPELRYALILQAETIEQVLQQSEQLKAPLDVLKQEAFISGYDMASHYLPSIKYQQAQQEKLPDASELKTRLDVVLNDSPLSVDAFSPFINAIDNSKQMPPLTAESLLGLLENQQAEQKNDFITDKIKVLLFQPRQRQQVNSSPFTKAVTKAATKSSTTSSRRWTAIIPLQGVQQQLPIDKLNQQVNFSVQLLDLKTQTESMLSNYRNDALLWFVLGSLLILAMLFSQNRKLSELFALVWPFSGAVILTIASLLLMGYSLSIFHLVTLLLVIGLGIDYSIFMLLPGRLIPDEQKNEITQSPEVAQVSVIICLFSTLIMFGALSLSDLPVLKAIGLTASLGALYAFLLARCSPVLIKAKR